MGIWLKLNQHKYFICVWYLPIYISNGNQLSKCWESNGDMIKWRIKGRVWCRITPRAGKHPTTLKWPAIVENFNQNIFWERHSYPNFQKHLTLVEGSQRGGSIWKNWPQNLSSFALHLCILYLQNLIITGFSSSLIKVILLMAEVTNTILESVPRTSSDCTLSEHHTDVASLSVIYTSLWST